MYCIYLVLLITIITLPGRISGALSDENRELYENFVEKLYDDNDNELFTSPEYLNLIPKDSNWINNELVNLPKQYSSNKEADEDLLDTFDVSRIEKKHKYSQTVQEALDLFNTWRKWQNGAESEWVQQKSVQDNDLKIYSKSVEGEAIDIIKGEVTFNYPLVVVIGVLLNKNHRPIWDEGLKDIRYLERLSSLSRTVYATMQSPSFVTDREILSVSFAFPMEDGSIILGSRSIAEADNEYEAEIKNDNHVRAFCNLALWHIRPDYDSGNLQQTKVTYYTQVSLGGYLPNLLVNKVSVDIPMSALKLRDYIGTLSDELHKPGCLWIPIYPCLHVIGVDINSFFQPVEKSEL